MGAKTYGHARARTRQGCGRCAEVVGAPWPPMRIFGSCRGLVPLEAEVVSASSDGTRTVTAPGRDLRRLDQQRHALSAADAHGDDAAP